ncbi:hypothetical protein GEV43_23955 [Actinomadura sp. J1-007]|uniref:Ig-like domain-containing protein n=1 Tax=Actinomadura sp. J1-007 TaxID=2661913 RepID=UPI00132CA1C4|nr:Ig-like domain-containing protein [Actinomadura sp. J1-007]MWK36812.1 hypothetical protein [Actinomadura sp. J1-007]
MARHSIVAGLRLGARIDAERGPGRSGRARAQADDRSGFDDEDALAHRLRVSAAGTLRGTVRVRNTTRRTATLAGWLDSGRGREFAGSGRVVVFLRPGARSATLTWRGRRARRGVAFVRLRLYAGQVRDPRPTGAAGAGEVEDHRVWWRRGGAHPAPGGQPAVGGRRPVITSPRNGALLRNPTPTISGRGTPGARVTVRFTDSRTPVAYSGAVTRAGTWRVKVQWPLVDGRYKVTPSTRTGSGPAKYGRPVRLTIDTTPPAAPAITGPADGAVLSDPAPRLTGRAEPGSTVTVTGPEGQRLVRTRTRPNGAWSAVPAIRLPDGRQALTPRATDRAGNSTSGSPLTITIDTVAPAAPTITGPRPGRPSKNPTPTFTGRAEPGTTVTITGPGGRPVATAQADATGAWTATPTVGLPDGKLTLIPRATDPAGNSTPGSPFAITIDTVAPSAPTVTSPRSGAPTKNPFPTFSGRAEPGTTISLVGPGGQPVATAKADASGLWTATPAIKLPDGAQTLIPRATDPAGNATSGSPLTLTIDTVAPSAPTVTSPRSGAPSKNPFPTFSGRAEPGTTISLVGPGGQPVATAKADATGAWTVTPTIKLPDGKLTLVPRATDPAGNATSGSPLAITIDTVAPAAPTFNGGQGPLADPRPLLSGTGEPRTKLKVFADGTEACTPTVQPNGTWHCTPCIDLAPGEHQITTTATDAAGNTSPGAQGSITITPPTEERSRPHAR